MNITLPTLLASFTLPMTISNSGLMFVWLVPLVVIIAIVYKATKMREITALGLAREVVVLSGTILIFMALIAAGLYAVMRVFTA